MISIKQLFFNRFHSMHIANYGSLLAYVKVSVLSELILSELHQHLFQRRTAFQQCTDVDELIK